MIGTLLLCLLSLLAFFPQETSAQSYMGLDFHPPPRLDMQYLDRFSTLGIDSYGFEFLIWNVVEPEAPTGGVHTYDWNYPDQMVQAIEQQNGRALITVWIASNWANREGFNYGETGFRPSIPPKYEYWDDFAEFVAAVVERYDGDGYEDMPGLKYPHLLYQFEVESELHWKGTSEEYVNLLAVFYNSAKRANPNARVISMGFNFSDFFDHNPTVEEIDSLLLPPGKQKRKEFVEYVLLHQDCFDVVGTNCNYSYTGLPARMRWIKSKVMKPVWCSDIVTGYLFDRHQFQSPLYSPYEYPFKTEYEIEYKLRNGGSGFHEIIEWASAEQAKYVLKKVVVAAASGYRRQYMQWAIETPNPIYGWVMVGLLEDNVPDGGIAEGTPRPAYYTIKQFLEKVGNFDSVEALYPLPAGVEPFDWTWIIKFTKDKGDIYVLWADSGGDTIDLSQHVQTAFVRVTHIVTELDENNDPVYPPDRIAPTNAIQVDATPVLVREEYE